MIRRSFYSVGGSTDEEDLDVRNGAIKFEVPTMPSESKANPGMSAWPGSIVMGDLFLEIMRQNDLSQNDPPVLRHNGPPVVVLELGSGVGMLGAVCSANGYDGARLILTDGSAEVVKECPFHVLRLQWEWPITDPQSYMDNLTAYHDWPEMDAHALFGSLDYILMADVLYDIESNEHLANVLIHLLEANKKAVAIMAHEHRFILRPSGESSDVFFEDFVERFVSTLSTEDNRLRSVVLRRSRGLRIVSRPAPRRVIFGGGFEQSIISEVKVYEISRDG
eukprot:GHVO01021293.1.p1 GENE.GHVO01021293.1~~GHVO01021293.1.p1  ORF type:complete len:278 (+),score=9.17 GHVO01021293.1:78-911(+)